MTYLETIASLFGLSMLLTPTAGVSFGDGIGIGTMNPWKYSGSTITISSTTASLRIPGLTNCDTIDTNGSGIFTCGTDASGSGGAGTVSTSTNETAGRLSYFTSTAGTPALLGEVATTTLTASSPLSLSQAVVKVGGSNSVLSLDTSGSWTGNAGTASALAANGSNCNSGFFPLGVTAAGVSENCTYAVATTSPWAANQFVYTNATGILVSVASSSLSLPNSALQNSTISGISLGSNLANLSATDSTLTFSGTYTGAIARTIGLNLGNTNTWTALQTFGNSSTTLASFGYASSTVWRGGGLTTDCDTAATSKLLWDATTGQFSCGTDQTGAGGSGITDLGPTGQQQTGTSQFFATSSDTNIGLTITSAANAHTFTSTWAGSLAIARGGTGSTTAPQGQLLYGGASAYQSVATSSASCTDGVACSAFAVVGTAAPSITATLGTSITAGEIADGDHGDFTYTGGVAAIDANAVALTTDTTGNYVATLADDGQTTVTVTNGSTEGGAATLRVIDVVCTGCLGTTEVAGLDISADTNLAVTYPIVLTDDTVSIAFGTTTANTWGALQTFSSGLLSTSSSTISSLSVTNGTTTNATSTTLNVSGQVDFDTLTSALVLAGSTGVLAEYAGASCTNQVVTAITAAGGATCTTLTSAYLDLTANYAWTGAHDFGGGVIEISNGSNPTVDAIGEIALDTTANELLIATSTTAAAPGVMKMWQPIRFSYASSTQGSGTTTRSLGVAPAAGYLDEIQCDFSNFMRVMIYDGTNRLNDLVASSTIGTVKFTTNNSFTSGEAMRIDIGTTTNIAANVYGGCTAKFYYTRN